MTKKELFESLKDAPDNANLVISQCFVIDEKDEITAEMHVPIVGVAYQHKEDKNEAEIRFLLTMDDIKQCFRPKDVTFFKPGTLERIE